MAQGRCATKPGRRGAQRACHTLSVAAGVHACASQSAATAARTRSTAASTVAGIRGGRRGRMAAPWRARCARRARRRCPPLVAPPLALPAGAPLRRRRLPLLLLPPPPLRLPRPSAGCCSVPPCRPSRWRTGRPCAQLPLVRLRGRAGQAAREERVGAVRPAARGSCRTAHSQQTRPHPKQQTKPPSSSTRRSPQRPPWCQWRGCTLTAAVRMRSIVRTRGLQAGRSRAGREGGAAGRASHAASAAPQVARPTNALGLESQPAGSHSSPRTPRHTGGEEQVLPSRLDPNQTFATTVQRSAAPSPRLKMESGN